MTFKTQASTTHLDSLRSHTTVQHLVAVGPHVTAFVLGSAAWHLPQSQMTCMGKAMQHVYG